MAGLPASIDVTLLHMQEATEAARSDAAVALLLKELETSTGGCLDARSCLATCCRLDKNIVPSAAAWKKLEERILRYVKMNDRYLALASVLLKSRAFHETYPRGIWNDDSSPDGTDPLPIIELPRTKHNKPFIPATHYHDSEAEEDVYPLSISHQYPFAGMVRLVADGSADNTPKQPQLAGFDIVVFDEINSNLYSSVQEFVDVFKDCFAASEWAAMNDNMRCPSDESQLREVYLRWAVKEAYTKALGVGLGFDFSSFETRIDNLDNETSMWTWISTGAATGETFLHATATVRQVPSSGEKRVRPQEEKWLFFFVPLFVNGDTSKMPLNMIGCGCVCVGPLPEESHATTFHPSLKLQWSSISELSTFHFRSSAFDTEPYKG